PADPCVTVPILKAGHTAIGWNVTALFPGAITILAAANALAFLTNSRCTVRRVAALYATPEHTEFGGWTISICHAVHTRLSRWVTCRSLDATIGVAETLNTN